MQFIDLSSLNEEQNKAVTHKSGRLLIVAGAGTGKTTVVTTKIGWLIEQGLAKPEEILALTFTEKACQEMQARLDQLLPLGYYNTWVHTFHGFSQRVLTEFALDFGLPSEYELLDETKSWILFRKHFEEFDLNYYRPLGSPNRFIGALLKVFSRLKDELITPQEFLGYVQGLKLDSGSQDAESQSLDIQKVKEVAESYHRFQRIMLDNGMLDFGDLIFQLYQGLVKRPNVLSVLKARFKYILVDEFQDTNFAQWKLIETLENNNLTVVGDDDQSIYKFRGASFSNIKKFIEIFPEADKVILATNYRSKQNILDLAYNFIQHNNPDRLEVKLGINKQLIAGTEGKGEILVKECVDLAEENRLIVERITERYEQSRNWNDTAILVRMNSQAEDIMPVLDNAGIPYRFESAKGLYDKPMVSFIIRSLRFFADLHDASHLLSILRTKRFYVSELDLQKLSFEARKKSQDMFEAIKSANSIEISDEARQSISQLLQLTNKYTDGFLDKNAVESFVYLVHDLGIVEELKEDNADTVEKRRLLEQFYKKVEKFEKENKPKTMRAFIADLELELESGSQGSISADLESGPETVKILTVHGAKGLEFKNVFIPGLIDRRFPSDSRADVIQIPDALIKDELPSGDFHLEEERRLFYVAVTRAKEYLWLSYSSDVGGKTYRKPSRFLVEAGLLPAEKLKAPTGKVVAKVHQRSEQQSGLQLPTNFSFSDLVAFRNCPFDYKYRYLLKLPMPGNPHLSFGTSIHGTLESYANEYVRVTVGTPVDLFGESIPSEPPSFDEMKRIYEKEWMDDWFNSKRERDEYKAKGVAMLHKAHEDFMSRKPTVKYIEQKFKLKIGEYTLSGRIDRVDEEDGKLRIIDYKTGKKKKIDKQGLDQLRIYQLALEEGMNERVDCMYYWYLACEDHDDKVVEQVASEEDKQALKVRLLESIEKIIATIKTNSFQQAHDQAPAHTCEYEALERI